MQLDKNISSKSQHPSRAPSPVPSGILHNDIASHKIQSSSPKLPLPQNVSQRRSSFSHQDQHEEKPLITHRSFPHLNSSKKQQHLYPNKQRRGSETTVVDDEVKNLSNTLPTDSIPAIRFASDKRNNDFHTLFRSVPQEERLIDDYGCALQKEILLQGRIYISEHHLCFNANIFGWITNLVVAFEDIADIEKKSTAIFIPNAILISTSTSKHFFASFLSRDQAFDQMVDLWRIYHTIQKTRKIEEECVSIHSNDQATDESDYTYSDYSYSEDEDDNQAETPNTLTSSHFQDKHDLLQSSLSSLPLPKHAVDDSAARRRAISEAGQKSGALRDYVQNKPEAASMIANYDETASKSLASLGSSLDDNSNTDEKYQRKEKTQCECSKKDQHFPTIVMDNVYSTSIETIYKLLFNSSFMTNFLSEVEKSTDICIGDWCKSEKSVHSRESSYIKYLGGSIGPKSTKCYLKEEVLHLDTSDYVSHLTVTQTPDVPAGSSFSVKTKTCISWSGQGQVRVLVTVLVEFIKSSWLRSTIEKASIDGQQNFYKNLDAAICKFLHSQVHRPITHKASIRRKRRKASSRRKQKHPNNQLGNTQQQQQHHHHHQPMACAEKAYLVIISDFLSWITDLFSSLTMAQLTLICMVIMVITNLYIAARLAGLDSHLDQLQSHPSPSRVSGYTMSDQEDTLWKILRKFDPESQPRVQHHDVNQDESASSDEHLPVAKSNKHSLDKNIMELEKIILRAGYNMNHVAQLVQDQKQNIIHFSN